VRPARRRPPSPGWCGARQRADPADVRARIARRLESPDGGARITGLQGIEVDIAPGPAGFVARIDLRGVTVANEVRVLTSARCDALTDAVAVVIARIAAERDEAAPRGAPEAAPGASGVVLRVAVPRSDIEAPRTWGIGLRATVLSGIGALPDVGVAGELAAYLWRRTMFAEVSAGRWMEGSRVLSDVRGVAEARLDIATVRLGWRSDRLPLRGWLGGELGSLHGESPELAGSSTDDSSMAVRRWVAIDAGFGVAWAMARRARLVGTIELGVPFTRARLPVRDGALMYRGEGVTVRSGLGLEVGW